MILHEGCTQRPFSAVPQGGTRFLKMPGYQALLSAQRASGKLPLRPTLRAAPRYRGTTRFLSDSKLVDYSCLRSAPPVDAT